MIHPFLVLEIPFYGFFDTLLKTGAMAPNLVPSATFENRWHNADKEQVKNAYTIFSIHLRFIKKQ